MGQGFEGLLITIAEIGGSAGERAGVVVTAYGTIALDRREATSPPE